MSLHDDASPFEEWLRNQSINVVRAAHDKGYVDPNVQQKCRMWQASWSIAQAELEAARAREEIARRKVEAADELYDLLQTFCQRFGEQDPELGEQARSLLQRIENGH